MQLGHLRICPNLSPPIMHKDIKIKLCQNISFQGMIGIIVPLQKQRVADFKR